MKNLSTQKFQQLLLQWFDQHGRKNLPWQKNKTPYRVWVSEIMLQQTQVSTVTAYFQRFMAHFPDVQTLARAPEDEVLHLWTGLGYYARARNLQHAAKMIVENQGGKFPASQAALEKLPGIGRSTAGAILSIAFEKKAAILDGNVKRVLSRLQGITEWPGEKTVTEKLWKLAEKYTPTQRSADYTQAIMDLGATLCIRGKPLCEQCPFKKYCIAYLQGIEKNLPQAKPKKHLPVRTTTFIILRKDSQFVLLEKRPPTGVWGNLWSFPEIKGKSSSTGIKKICQQRFQAKIKEVKFCTPFRHTFSHFHLDITPASAIISHHKANLMEPQQQIWYNLHRPQALGLPAPVKRLLENTFHDSLN